MKRDLALALQIQANNFVPFVSVEENMSDIL